MISVRYTVAIDRWDWNLHVGVRPQTGSPDRATNSDLLVSQAIAIEGLLAAPDEHRAKRIHLTLYPQPPEVISGDGEAIDVGRFHEGSEARPDLDFVVSLFLPQETLQSVILCLNTKWRSLNLWVDDDSEIGSVTDFAFSGEVEG